MRFAARARFAVPPEKLWPLLSDTDRLNQAMGLPLMRFRAEPLDTGGSRVIGEHPIGSAALAFLGQLLPLDPRRVRDERLLRWLPQFPVARWLEHPFEWEAPRHYAVRRDYFWSLLGLFPFRRFRGGVELLPTVDGGAEVVAFADIEPRNPPGALVTRLVLGPKSCTRVIDQCRRFERYLLGHAPDPFPDLRRTRPVSAATRPPEPPGDGGQTPIPDAVPAATGTSEAWARLVGSGVAPELVARLRQYLEAAPDDEVLKMRPFELADRWGRDRRETLIAFLHATTAGLVGMSWEVLCPNCRIPKGSFGSLADLQDRVHCDFCNISFDAAIDRQVEVRFSVAESVRHVEDRRFCSGGPMNTPHVVAQATLAPGARRALEARLAPGAYRLRSLQSKAAAVIDVREDAAPGSTDRAAGSAADGALAVTVTPAAILPPLSAGAAGRVRVEVENRGTVPALVVLEEPGWPDTAATAALVGTIQEFRDLFASEVLAPGLQLAIQRLAFLFTDLTGSTAIYQAVGQARAFRLVQEHFALLAETIQAHRGAVVKTIGDAVMATFPTGGDAVAAALAMQRAIRRLDTGGAVDPARLLKIGVHEGPCIAVTANGRLDYFGTTINIASRVEHECPGGQVVMTADVYQDPAVQAKLRQEGLEPEPAETRLRGIAAPVQLHRIAVSAHGTA
ncbi:MAG TPA: DUF5939 domain-containing protein [Chloroflexota bacterium]|nr:DUF5939 domain-containing protein [Chloroflexota bacterium]